MATATVSSSENSVEKRSTQKLDAIRNIESQMQNQWYERKCFEADAPKKWTNKFVNSSFGII